MLLPLENLGSGFAVVSQVNNEEHCWGTYLLLVLILTYTGHKIQDFLVLRILICAASS
jgi:hypothetical protein